MSTRKIERADRARGPSTALARADPEIATWRDPQWQQLWLALEPRDWLSLALVPAGEGAPLDFTLIVAVGLSRTGMVHLGKPIQVADATRIPLDYLTAFLADIRRCTSVGERLLIALPPLVGSPIAASIANTADAAVLCVLLEKMSSAQAKSAVRQVGASRFLGSAIFRSDQIARAV